MPIPLTSAVDFMVAFFLKIKSIANKWSKGHGMIPGAWLARFT